MDERIRINELEQKLQKIEKALADCERDLADERGRSAQSERLGELGQIALGIGHELRQPLSVISTSAYCIRAAAAPLADRAAAGAILRHLDRLDAQLAEAARTITSLMDYARTQKPAPRAVDLNQLIRAQLAVCEIPESVTLTQDLCPQMPPVLADPGHIERVIHILMDNAMDSLVGLAGEVTLRTFSEDAVAGFEVRDTGAGVQEELRDKVFQPFVTTKARGVGIGLALGRLLVESNSGSIGFASRPGAGSIFQVRLPRSS